MSEERHEQLHDTPAAAGEFEQASERADETVAAFEDQDSGRLRRLQHFLHANPTTIPFIVLLLGVLLLRVVVGGRFFAPFNLSLILQQVTIIGIVGIAQTLVILTAGIDLSVGAIMVLSSVVMGQLAVRLRRAATIWPSSLGLLRRRRSAAASTACWSPC